MMAAGSFVRWSGADGGGVGGSGDVGESDASFLHGAPWKISSLLGGAGKVGRWHLRRPLLHSVLEVGVSHPVLLQLQRATAEVCRGRRQVVCWRGRLLQAATSGSVSS